MHNLPNTKVCVACGRTFERPGNIGQKQWDSRKFCSMDCRCDAWVGAGHPRWMGGRTAMRYMKEYGITMEQFNEMVARQEGLCAVCQDRPATHVDHDHESGAVRAVLCNTCNAGLGLFQEDADLIERAAEYLRSYMRVTIGA